MYIVMKLKSDFNLSKKLDAKEAVYLATLPLSLDSLAAGFGSSLGNINHIHVIGIISLIHRIAFYLQRNLYR